MIKGRRTTLDRSLEILNKPWLLPPLTCHAVVLPLVQQDPVLLPQLSSVYFVIKDGVHPRLVKAERGLPEPHVVDVHVGGAHPELADMFVQRISLKPHGTEEGDLGKLIVEYVFTINYPNSCKELQWLVFSSSITGATAGNTSYN